MKESDIKKSKEHKISNKKTLKEKEKQEWDKQQDMMIHQQMKESSDKFESLDPYEVKHKK